MNKNSLAEKFMADWVCNQYTNVLDARVIKSETLGRSKVLDSTIVHIELDITMENGEYEYQYYAVWVRDDGGIETFEEDPDEDVLKALTQPTARGS